MEQLLVMKRVGILSGGHPNPLPHHCQTLPSVPPHQTLQPYCNPITHPQTPAPPLLSSPACKHLCMRSPPCPHPPPYPLYSPCYHLHTLPTLAHTTTAGAILRPARPNPPMRVLHPAIQAGAKTVLVALLFSLLVHPCHIIVVINEHVVF